MARGSWADPALTPWGPLSGQGGTRSKRNSEEAPSFPMPVPSRGCSTLGCREEHGGGEGKNGVAEALCLLGDRLYDLCLRVFHTN